MCICLVLSCDLTRFCTLATGEFAKSSWYVSIRFSDTMLIMHTGLTTRQSIHQRLSTRPRATPVRLLSSALLFLINRAESSPVAYLISGRACSLHQAIWSVRILYSNIILLQMSMAGWTQMSLSEFCWSATYVLLPFTFECFGKDGAYRAAQSKSSYRHF